MWLLSVTVPPSHMFHALEDQQRLADIEGSSSYGAVSSPAVRDAGDQRADQQDGAAGRAGCGMYLYLGVLVSVVLSGLVRSALTACKGVSQLARPSDSICARSGGRRSICICCAV